MAKNNLVSFLQGVRSEASKVTWPSRKETLITTGLVFVMVIVAFRTMPRPGKRKIACPWVGFG